MNTIEETNALSCEIQFLEKAKTELDSQLSKVRHDIDSLLTQAASNNGNVVQKPNEPKMYELFKDKAVAKLALSSLNDLLNDKRKECEKSRLAESNC